MVEAFDYFFFNYQATPLLVIKADEVDLTRESDLEDIVAQIRQMKKASLYYVPPSYAGKDARRK